MFEKKNLLINSDVCDARKIKKEDYEKYENITLNADVLFVDERSQSVLNELPILMNVDKVMELEPSEDYKVQSVNGSYELKGQEAVQENTILCVNGSLSILPESRETLGRYKAILVNGSVEYPDNLAQMLGMLKVNGSVTAYPADCILLKEEFIMDRYFPLRAKENGKYYAKEKVVLADPQIDTAVLAEKKVEFVTEELVVLEDKVEDAVLLVREDVKMTVIPSGYVFVDKDVELSERTLKKYGNKLYIWGDLTIKEDGITALSQLEGLKVDGDVCVQKKCLEQFEELDAEYDDLVILKGRQICNAVKVSLDAATLEREPDGVRVLNAAKLCLAEDISPEMILEKLEIVNCGLVSCSKEQEGAVGMIGKNIGSMNGEKGGLMDKMKMLADMKLINADEYIL